jgi:hypothetical protein
MKPSTFYIYCCASLVALLSIRLVQAAPGEKESHGNFKLQPIESKDAAIERAIELTQLEPVPNTLVANEDVLKDGKKCFMWSEFSNKPIWIVRFKGLLNSGSHSGSPPQNYLTSFLIVIDKETGRLLSVKASLSNNPPGMLSPKQIDEDERVMQSVVDYCDGLPDIKPRISLEDALKSTFPTISMLKRNDRTRSGYKSVDAYFIIYRSWKFPDPRFVWLITYRDALTYESRPPRVPASTDGSTVVVNQEKINLVNTNSRNVIDANTGERLGVINFGGPSK